jgi:glycosyltransferase involved in cell wall biosynthesis/putative flippase GtrA
MKVISIGTDRKLFKENSAVRQRVIEYGKSFEELHIVVFNIRNLKHEIRDTKIAENLWIYPTNSVSRLFYVWDIFVVAKKLIGNYRDVVISSQDPFETGLVGALLKLFLNLPLHIQVHTDLMHKYFIQLSLLNKIRFFIAEFVLKYSDRVRVVSERIKKSIELFNKNIDVLPIKMEISEEELLEIEKPFPFTLLMVCRLEKEKNIETVFQAIKNLRNNDIGLCLVGDGSQRADLEQMAKDLGIYERVFFAGWQNNLASYYKMANAFVSASLYEGYGISTVEAAYFGKPLILSETGVAEEIFKKGESAFVCDAKDENSFIQSILSLYKDKNLAEKMGQLAKIAADKHLNSQNQYIKEYADSIIKTVSNFKKRGFLSRIFYFKNTAFNSFMILRYFICGITAAATNIFLLYIFTDIFGVWYLYSSVLAFFLALVVSFVLQKFVVFKDNKTDGLKSQFSKFLIAAVLGVLTNTALVFVFVDIFGIWYIFSQVIAGVFVMVQNFILYKLFIFNK